jgi:hypothetical protein
MLPVPVSRAHRASCYPVGMTEALAPEKLAGGRPSKLTPEFLAAAYEVINHEDNALILADEELLFQINEKLSPEAKISKRAFETWKSGALVNDVEGRCLLRLPLS